LARVMELAEVLGKLAHDLNQPLAAILINAEAAMQFLQPEKLDLEEVRAILTDIVADNKRARETIEKMRGLFEQREVRPQPLDVNELVHVVLNLVRGDLLKHNIAVEMCLAENLPRVPAQSVQLQHLLLNLVANGCDAMLGIAARDRKLTLRTELADGAVKISVIDRGGGVSAQQIEQIFQPFFTTKGNGIGLGLTVCRSIASAHGGELWATSEAKGGTAFHLLLPQTKPAQ